MTINTFAINTRVVNDLGIVTYGSHVEFDAVIFRQAVVYAIPATDVIIFRQKVLHRSTYAANDVVIFRQRVVFNKPDTDVIIFRQFVE